MVTCSLLFCGCIPNVHRTLSLEAIQPRVPTIQSNCPILSHFLLFTLTVSPSQPDASLSEPTITRLISAVAKTAKQHTYQADSQTSAMQQNSH
ncbi:hypothetical protein E2C01_088844 [Portunus trituberculatus]|uniref:Uncharacterized protein n=1 Tax=Portunus trituberculatus TaxID=210409 RepID=A0A5B7JMZ4_PORTR|nr:hypothetical protein [Portunus trituberculatus]